MAYQVDRWVDRAHTLAGGVGAHPSELEELELVLACHFAAIDIHGVDEYADGDAPGGVVTPYWTRAVSSFPAFSFMYHGNTENDDGA